MSKALRMVQFPITPGGSQSLHRSVSWQRKGRLRMLKGWVKVARLVRVEA